MAAANYTPSMLLTGYENVLAHRNNELYCKVAENDGEVIKVDKHGLYVKYIDNKTDSYPLGITLGKASGEIHKHVRVTDLKVGAKFTKGDVIGWNSQFYDRDILNPMQVALKFSTMANIALTEGQFQFEDSLEVSETFSQESKSSFIKSKEINVKFTETVTLLKNINDLVEYDSILCEIEDPVTGGLTIPDENLIGLTKLGIIQKKAETTGKIIKIDVFYNGNVDEMSNSLKDIVTNADKQLAKEMAAIETNYKVTGNINSNLNVQKPSIYPNTVKIIFQIERELPSTHADKFVAGIQMKGTTGNIFTGVIKGLLDDQPIDIKFSCKSLYSRMVVSLRNKLVACKYIKGINTNTLKIYLGESKK